MRRVHVGLNLENEAREFLIVRRDETVARHARLRRRRHADIAFEEVLHAEVRHGRAEEHRRELAGVDLLHVEFLTGFVEKLDIVLEGLPRLLAHALDDGRVIRLVDIGDARFLAVRRVGGKEQHLVVAAVVDAHVLTVLADWPVHRVGADAEHVLDLIHDVNRQLAVMVELVDERENGDAALLADLEKLLRLSLDALGDIDDHDGAVDGHERAACVSSEKS